jgi:dipeptidyl aminopeptidase/acylaminoacyl peptidase
MACTQAPPGRKLASAIARGLIARDGAVAFLVDAAHPGDRAVPDDLLAGDLWLDDRKVGAGVSTQDGAYAFAPRGGELAYLAAWRFREGEGELWVASRTAAPRQVAKVARSFAWSPRGELAFVGKDQLGIGEHVIALPGIQAVAWSADGKRVAARASAAAGGKLWAVDPQSKTAREIAFATSDFAFAPDGAIAALGPPPPKGGDRPLLLEGVRLATATAFAFSPDGRELALLSTEKQPGEASGDLYRMPRSGGVPRLLASRVTDWRWSSGGDLVCLARYDLRARAGTLTVAAPAAAPREIAHKVQSFSIFGRRLLYLVQAPEKGDFKLELWAADLATPQLAPHRIDEGAYGWQLSPDGATLYYKARCAGAARSCSLLRTAFSRGAPELLASNVAGFDLSRDGGRILLQQPHRGSSRAVDLAVISATAAAPERVKPLAEEVDPSSRFADDAGRRIVYAIVAAGRGGVFLADVP